MNLRSSNVFKVVACIIVLVGASSIATASCGDSLSAMAASAAAAQVQSRPIQNDSHSAPKGARTSIVGLWHIQFKVGDQTIQEAFQLWNVGGTEVHNPNVDPRTGNICLGVWRHAAHESYKLAHRVWRYDESGTFMGTINLSETVTLGHHGTTHSGTFTLDFYDPSGNFITEVVGSVVGDRISVQ